MEPLGKSWRSVWYWVFWDVYRLTPYSEAWGSVYDRLWYWFDWSFTNKDK